MALSPLQQRVIAFVKAHDSNPQNKVADRLNADQVNQKLAQDYNREILQATTPLDFHSANEALFEFIPPSKRDQFLKWLTESCQKTSSAACEQGAAPALPTPKLSNWPWEKAVLVEQDLKATSALEQVQDLGKIPAISPTQHGEIYEKIQWWITHAKAQGENEAAKALETALQQGKLKYLPDLKIAQAFADPREPGVIVFGKSFFERSWADETRGLDGKPIKVSDEEVVQKARFILNFGKRPDSPEYIKIDTLKDLELFKALPQFHPDNLRRELAAELSKDLPQRYQKYFGNLPINTFPRNMPSWIILLGHELRHTLQIAQDRKEWSPEWTKQKKFNFKGFAYYNALGRFYNAKKKNNPGSAQSGESSSILLKEGSVEKKLRQLGDVREREATDYGVKIAQKLVQDWVKTAR